MASQMFEVKYVRDRKPEFYLLPFAQAKALADYLRRTFRIEVTVRRAA